MKENKKYTTPEIEIIDIDCEDIIQTSGGGLIDGGTGNAPGSGTGDGSGTGTGTGDSSIFSLR